MKNKFKIYFTIFSIIVLCGTFLISPVQSKLIERESEKILQEIDINFENIKNLKKKFFKGLINLINIDLNDILEFLDNLVLYILMISYCGFILSVIGKLLTLIGFEVIGYRAFTFGMRFFAGGFFTGSVLAILMIFIDVLIRWSNGDELYA